MDLPPSSESKPAGRRPIVHCPLRDENGASCMALYVDSAFLHDIMNVAQTVPLAGVTTNPTILLAAHERGQDLSPQGVLDALLRNVAGTIFMQPGASGEEEMYAEALVYIQAAPGRVIPKIPMTHTGMRVARRLSRVRKSYCYGS